MRWKSVQSCWSIITYYIILYWIIFSIVRWLKMLGKLKQAIIIIIISLFRMKLTVFPVTNVLNCPTEHAASTTGLTTPIFHFIFNECTSHPLSEQSKQCVIFQQQPLVFLTCSLAQHHLMIWHATPVSHRSLVFKVQKGRKKKCKKILQFYGIYLILRYLWCLRCIIEYHIQFNTLASWSSSLRVFIFLL